MSFRQGRTGFESVADVINQDPTTGGGVAAPIGTIAAYNGFLYAKLSASNTGWQLVATAGAPGSFAAPLLVGGPTVDPLGGGFTTIGGFSDINNGGANLLVANKNTGTFASAQIYLLCGSWDGTVGANASVGLTGPNTIAGLGGPLAFQFVHSLPVGQAGTILFWNQGSVAGCDTVFKNGNTEVARFTSTGVQLEQPVTMTVPGSSVVQAFKTATFDFTTTGFYALNTPLVAGKTFIPVAGRLVIVTRNAALTGGPTVSLAQNGIDISQAVQPSTVTLNGSAAPANYASLPAGVNNADMTTNPIQLHVSVGCSGAGLTSCTAYFVLTGMYL